MSSQASSAGGEEGKVRQKLIETGAMEAMVDIRGNFFYTRSVPCQLWFLNKDKSAEHQDKVLMVDARNVYRKVTRKIFDFTPEQEKNHHSIFWLTVARVSVLLGWYSPMWIKRSTKRIIVL